MKNDQAVPGVVNFMGIEGYFRNGKFRPIISGGADDEEDSDSDNSEEEGKKKDDTGSKNQEDTDSDKSGGKTFTQAELDAIVQREKKAASKGKVKLDELGFKSKDELDTFIRTMKEKADEDKSEQEKKLEDAVKAAKGEARDEVLGKANKRIIKAEFKIAAHEAGVRKEALNDAFAVAQLMDEWEVEVDEDKDEVVGLTDEFFKELKKQKSYLFADKEEGKKKKGDAGAGANGGGEAKKDLSETYSGLKNMM